MPLSHKNPSVTFTRPADTTAYASGDLVANSTTAGSVVFEEVDLTVTSAGSVAIKRIGLKKSGTGTTNASFRVHLFRTLPTTTGGDNAALAVTGLDGYIGTTDITVDKALADGAAGWTLASGDALASLRFGTNLKSVFVVVEARGAYTPASAEEITVEFDVAR